MAPVYLNPLSSSFPLVELKGEQQLHLFLSSPHQASSSLSGPNFFSTTDQGQRETTLWGTHQHDQGEVDEYNLSLGRSCDHNKVIPSSSFQSAVVNHDDTSNVHKVSPSCKREDEAEGSGTHGSVKWMQKLMLSSNSSSEADHKPAKFTLKFQGQHKEVNSSSNNNDDSSIRVCSDCNTTSTPLWRSGPRGPKSLCNACGIRQRKARRAIAVAAAAAAAANGTVIAIEASSSSPVRTNKANNKEKKSRTSHVSQCKKLCKLPHDQSQNKQLCNFKNLAISLSKSSALQLGVLPQDVEEAAILLMELSCGFIHT